MSSLLTQCPHCQTSFRVSRHQLGAASGQVRCGACLGVFSALSNEIRVKAPDSLTPELPFGFDDDQAADSPAPLLRNSTVVAPDHHPDSHPAFSYQPGDFHVGLDDDTPPVSAPRLRDTNTDTDTSVSVHGTYSLRYGSDYLAPDTDQDIALGDMDLDSLAQDDKEPRWSSTPADAPGHVAALTAEVRAPHTDSSDYPEYLEYEDPEPEPEPALLEAAADLAACDTSSASGFVVVEQYSDDIELSSWLDADESDQRLAATTSAPPDPEAVLPSPQQRSTAGSSWLDDEDDDQDDTASAKSSLPGVVNASASWLDDDDFAATAVTPVLESRELPQTLPLGFAAAADMDHDAEPDNDSLWADAIADEAEVESLGGARQPDSFLRFDEGLHADGPDAEDGATADTHHGRHDYSEIRARHTAPVPDASKARLRSYLDELEDDDALDELDPDALYDVDADPLTISTRPAPRQFWRNAGLGLANLALLGALGLQFVSAHLEQLDQSARFTPFRPLLCLVLNCPPAPPLASSLYPQQLVVRMHPRLENALEVSLVVHNDSVRAQDFPQLELSFRNDQDQLVASRRFSPTEYLPPELRSIAQMPAQSSVQVQLDLMDPGPTALHYSIALRDI